MTFDRRVVCQRLATRCPRGKCYEFWRQHRIGAECACDIRRYWRNSFVQAYCHAHRILFVCCCLALLRSEVTHRDDAYSGRARVAYLGVHLYAYHILVIDLEGACRLFQLSPGEGKCERGEQDHAARDDE